MHRKIQRARRIEIRIVFIDESRRLLRTDVFRKVNIHQHKLNLTGWSLNPTVGKIC